MGESNNNSTSFNFAYKRNSEKDFDQRATQTLSLIFITGRNTDTQLCLYAKLKKVKL